MSKTGKPQFDPSQATALLTQDLPHVADVRADSAQVFKHKIVDVFSHGSTLTVIVVPVNTRNKVSEERK